MRRLDISSLSEVRETNVDGVKSLLNIKRRYHSPTQLTTPENTITCHNALCLTPQNFA